jgi:hypothetical protein
MAEACKVSPKEVSQKMLIDSSPSLCCCEMNFQLTWCMFFGIGGTLCQKVSSFVCLCVCVFLVN